MKKGVNISIKNGRRVVEGLGYYEPRIVNDLRELVRGSAARYGDKPAFRFRDKAGNIVRRSYNDLNFDVDCLGTAMTALGMKGLRISIIGENRYEWGVCYFAIVNGTGVAVPLDRHLPENEIENLTTRGKVEAIFTARPIMTRCWRYQRKTMPSGFSYAWKSLRLKQLTPMTRTALEQTWQRTIPGS